MQVQIRKIQPGDNKAIMRIIQHVMPEFGAGGPGFAIHDPEVHDMYNAYQKDGAAYFVCEVNRAIVGGAGIAPLQGGDPSVCELKKMYFLSEIRGKGYGKLVLDACIHEARKQGYRKCYIETFNTMKIAMNLYERNGFVKIDGPLGSTGHFACDTFYILDLR